MFTQCLIIPFFYESIIEDNTPLQYWRPTHVKTGQSVMSKVIKWSPHYNGFMVTRNWTFDSLNLGIDSSYIHVAVYYLLDRNNLITKTYLSIRNATMDHSNSMLSFIKWHSPYYLVKRQYCIKNIFPTLKSQHICIVFVGFKRDKRKKSWNACASWNR